MENKNMSKTIERSERFGTIIGAIWGVVFFYLLMMILNAIVAFMFMKDANAACATLERPNGNYTYGQSIGSTQLNADFNAAYDRLNSLDGGCTESGTIEPGALSADMAAVKDNARGSCNVYWDGTNFKIDMCQMALGGEFINKTTATTFNFGLNCTSCSAQAQAEEYFIYALSTSSSGTLNIKISTTGPTTANGYSNSGDRLIAKFWTLNNVGMAVDELSIEQYTAEGKYQYIDRLDGYFKSCANSTIAAISSWVTASTLTFCGERRNGKFLETTVRIGFTGAPDNVNMVLTTGRVYRADYNGEAQWSSGSICKLTDLSATATYMANVKTDLDSSNLYYLAVSSTFLVETVVTRTAPYTIANGDSIQCDLREHVWGWD